MIVYVIDKSRLISFTLPQRIYGSYWITDIDDDNQEKKIINIQEEDGKWVAYSNKSVNIIDNNQSINKIILEPYSFFLLKLKNQEGYLILYISPLNDPSKKTFLVPNNATISIGSSKENVIYYRNQLTSNEHVKLEYKNIDFILFIFSYENYNFCNRRERSI